MKRIAAYALAIVLIASQAVAQTSRIPGTLDALIAAAKNEGSLDLVWSESLMGGSDVVQKHEAAFNKMFGTSISFKFAPGPEVARLGNQLLTEKQAGQPASSDVYIGAAAQIEPLLQNDLFQSVPWHILSPDRIHDADIEQDGKALRLQTALSGVTYNTSLIKTPPVKLTDFLDPQWKGKLASTPYAAGFDILAANDFWGPEKTIDFVRKLSSQVAGLIRCGDIERIATGEYSALVMDCLSNTEVEWEARGAPVGYAIMADAAQKRYYYASITRNAPHPNAAALFTVYLLSKEGQRILWESMHTDLDSLEGSQTAETVAEYEKKGVQFPEITIDWWSKHPEIDQAKDEMIKALSRK